MAALKFTIEQIVWQEVPGEVSLAFLFSGCPLRCKGCHSADAWKEGIGTELTEDYLKGRLKRYRGLISCVLFMGGEWQPEALQKMLGIVTQAGLKACLYTGLEREELDGLDSPTTNQKFIDLRTGEVLNRLFIKDKPAPKIIPITTQPQAAAFQTA